MLDELLSPEDVADAARLQAVAGPRPAVGKRRRRRQGDAQAHLRRDKPADPAQVFVTSVQFQLAVGQPPCKDPTVLTCGGGDIQVEKDPDKDWTQPHDKTYGTFTFSRPTGVDPKAGDHGYTFELLAIPVSPVVGTTIVTVTETSSPNGANDCIDRTATFEVPKFPGDFGSVAFEPDKPSVPPGGQTILRWQGDPATKYTLSWPGQKPIVVANHGLRTTPRSTRTRSSRSPSTYQSEGGPYVHTPLPANGDSEDELVFGRTNQPDHGPCAAP